MKLCRYEAELYLCVVRHLMLVKPCNTSHCFRGIFWTRLVFDMLENCCIVRGSRSEAFKAPRRRDSSVTQQQMVCLKLTSSWLLCKLSIKLWWTGPRRPREVCLITWHRGVVISKFQPFPFDAVKVRASDSSLCVFVCTSVTEKVCLCVFILHEADVESLQFFLSARLRVLGGPQGQ